MALTFSNISPSLSVINASDFDLTQAISFDATLDVDIASIAVWVRFANSEERVVVYGVDQFEAGFVDLCTISGTGVTRSFSLIENSSKWRARPVELIVWTATSAGVIEKQDVLS